MAYSYAVTVASGSSDLVTVPFPFLSQDHVHITLDNEAVADDDLTWITDGQLQLPSTPAAAVSIRVYRTTPREEMLTTFSPGNLDHRDMNNSLLQLLYVMQEAFDAVTTEGSAEQDILDYLAQILAMYEAILDMYEQIQEWYEEIQALLAAFAFYFDVAFSTPFGPTDGQILASWPIAESLLFDEDAVGFKAGSHSGSATSGDSTFDVKVYAGNPLAAVTTLGRFTLAAGAETATWLTDVGHAVNYTIAANSTIVLLAVTVDGALDDFHCNIRLERIIP
jgi:hypothetical protein